MRVGTQHCRHLSRFGALGDSLPRHFNSGCGGPGGPLTEAGRGRRRSAVVAKSYFICLHNIGSNKLEGFRDSPSYQRLHRALAVLVSSDAAVIVIIVLLLLSSLPPSFRIANARTFAVEHH